MEYEVKEGPHRFPPSRQLRPPRGLSLPEATKEAMFIAPRQLELFGGPKRITVVQGWVGTGGLGRATWERTRLWSHDAAATAAPAER